MNRTAQFRPTIIVVIGHSDECDLSLQLISDTSYEMSFMDVCSPQKLLYETGLHE